MVMMIGHDDDKMISVIDHDSDNDDVVGVVVDLHFRFDVCLGLSKRGVLLLCHDQFLVVVAVNNTSSVGHHTCLSRLRPSSTTPTQLPNQPITEKSPNLITIITIARITMIIIPSPSPLLL